MGEDKGFNGGVARAPLPPDEQRCTRNDGKGWRCKGFKFQGHNYCEKHYINCYKKRSNVKTKQDKGPLKKRQKRKGVDFVLDSSEEEDLEEEEDDEESCEDEEELIIPERKKRRGYSNEEEEGFPKRQTRRPWGSTEEEIEEVVQVQPTIINTNYTEAFGMRRSDECSISELIFSLKASFRNHDFEKVVLILKLREEYVKMQKEEAEKKAACFKEELKIREVNCNKLLNEVEERRMREVNAVEENLRELELKRVAIEEELHRYKRMYIELRTDYLESVKRRAENEIGLPRKIFQALETKGFSTDVYVEPRGFSTDVSYTEEGKRNVTRQMEVEGGTDCTLDRGWLSSIKIKEEALDFNAKVYASPSVDSNCHSPAKESGIEQHAESGVKDGSVAREKAACQAGGSFVKTQTSPKMEHGSITREQMASQPNVSSYKMGTLRPASEGITKMNNGSLETKAKPIYFEEGSGQKQNGGENGSSSEEILASTTERKCIRKEGTINNCRFRALEGLASGFNYHSGSSDSKSCVTPPENSKESVTSPGQKSISVQELAEKGNSSAKKCNEKEVKDFGSDHGAGCNGISKFLHELRRLKANKPNWKGSPLLV